MMATNKTKKMDPSEIEKVISAIRDREVDSTVPAPDQTQIRDLRHGLQKQLAPIFERAGLDVEEINRILRQHQQDLRNLVEEHKSQAKTHRAARAEKMRAALAQRSSVLNSIANQPGGGLSNLNPIQEASGIYALPAGMLVSSTIEPQDNWAQIYYEDSTDTSGSSVYLYFLFEWLNQFPYQVVLAASTNLGANGEINGTEEMGFFSSGSFSILLWATLDAYVGYLDINYPMGQSAIGSYVAPPQGFGTAILWEPVPIFNYNYLCCQPIPVDAGQIATFLVSMRADIKINDGSVSLDFSSNDGFVMCPEITLQLLSGGPSNAPPPSQAAALFQTPGGTLGVGIPGQVGKDG
jgi:hypothetical protein